MSAAMKAPAKRFERRVASLPACPTGLVVQVSMPYEPDRGQHVLLPVMRRTAGVSVPGAARLTTRTFGHPEGWPSPITTKLVAASKAWGLTGPIPSRLLAQSSRPGAASRRISA